MKETFRKPSHKLTFEDAKLIWIRSRRGEFQNRIAADLDVNPGRANDVLKGRKFPDSRAAALGDD